MSWTTTLGGHSYGFADLRELLAKATPARSGDVLAGVAAESAAERVAAQTVLADLPLAHFLDEAVVPYEDDDVTRLIMDSHDAAAFAPVAVADRRRLPRLAAVLGGRHHRAERPRARAHARDGGGGQQAHARRRPGRRGAQDPRRHGPAHDDRPRGPAGDAPAAQPPDRRPRRHHRVAGGRAAARRRRRGGRHQPRHRPALDGARAARADRRRAPAARGADPVVRAHARDHHAGAARTGRAGRPRLPVRRRHPGRQPGLRGDARPAARGPRRGVRAAPRHRRQQRHVLRDGAGFGAVGRRPPRRRRSRPSRPAPTPCAGRSTRCSSTPSSASSARSTSTTASRSCAPAWRTTSAASCSASRWASTSATPTTPRPTPTTPTPCCSPWAPRAARS